MQTEPAEKTHYQLLYVRHGETAHFYREGLPTTDLDVCNEKALDLMGGNDVKEAFVCTVHAAYTKETTVKKVL